MMAAYGDEPRRIRLGALHGRFLIELGDFDAVTRLVMDCERASRRLRIANLHNDIVALGGRLHLALGRNEEAVRTLRSVYGHFDRSVTPLRCAETLLSLREAAAAVGDNALLEGSNQAQRNSLRMFPGLKCALLASIVRILCRAGAFAEAQEHVSSARSSGEGPGESIWLEQLADRLERKIEMFNGGSA
jgi:hypothetical protein